MALRNYSEFSLCIHIYVSLSRVRKVVWEFPKLRGTILGVPIRRTIVFGGPMLGSPYLGKLLYGVYSKLGTWTWSQGAGMPQIPKDSASAQLDMPETEGKLKTSPQACHSELVGFRI